MIMDKFDLMLFYFCLGMNYNHILNTLVIRHRVVLSNYFINRLIKKRLQRKQCVYFAAAGLLGGFTKRLKLSQTG